MLSESFHFSAERPLNSSTPIHFVTRENFDATLSRLGEIAAQFARSCGFEPKPGRVQILPDAAGAVAAVLFGADPAEPLAAGALANALPEGDYHVAEPVENAELAALGFLLAGYKFTRFKSADTKRARLVACPGVDLDVLAAMAKAVHYGRDLINTPANALTPSALAIEAAELGRSFGAEVDIIEGDALESGFPLIAAVGAAASEGPRLVDFRWGEPDAPKVTLVGKGVVFDTGGLDIKPANGMELMKKDMGGAATALTLARLIMQEKLPVRLRVLIPIVENAIAARAMRPGDIYRSRTGLTVEIGNTDAEGRLILADALALACEETPDLLFDFATLTGAARVALGPEVPPFYTDDDALAAEIAESARAVADPVWRMPLWKPYAAMLDSPVADLNNAPGSPFAGSITAALFLQRFVDGVKAWAHFDVYAWSPKARAVGPLGGEIQAARALLHLLQARYSAPGKKLSSVSE